jgi:outer membrane protein assembly factor BamB
LKNTKTSKITTIILTSLLIASTFLILSTSTVAALDTSIPADMIQYDWVSYQHDPEHTNYNPGPGPSAPNIKWKTKIPGVSGYPIAFNGLLFVGARGTTYALDGGTGEIVWTADLSGQVTKIDETYMMIGSTCVLIEDGSIVWEAPADIGDTLQSFSYNIGYVPELKMFMGARGRTLGVEGGKAWNLPDPSQPPTLAWSVTDQMNIMTGFWVYGDGKAFSGSNDGFLYAFDAQTGDLLWKTAATSMFFYCMTYYNGRIYFGGLDNNLNCWDANTGELLWTYNPQTWYGQWSLVLGAAHGMIYGKNQDTYLYAINADTGQLVWRAKGPGIGYSNKITISGDKIYTQMGEYQYRDFLTGEYAFPEYNCYNALTGELIWTLPLETGAPANSDCAAYGNLYLLPKKGSPAIPGYWEYGGGGSLDEVWCISSETVDWPMFMKDPEHTADGAGPTNLALKWKFKTGAMTYASPSIADGVCYVGSLDNKIYALDAETGSQKWTFETEFPVVSSVAVVNDRVYTGADDGNIYCLDADTGAKIWETFAGGVQKNIIYNSIAVVQCRSSPVVVNGKLYVGALDGNLYCLDTNNGNVIWTYQTDGPILAAPAVADNAVYFPSTRGGYPVGWGPEVTEGDFYKLNADTGSVIWHKEIPYVLNRTSAAGNFLLAAPVVADGKVFVRNGFYENFALDAETGNTLWTYLARFNEGTRSQWGGVVQINAPLYAYGMLFMNDYYGVVALNASSGEEVWFAWLSRENLAPALAYAYGRVYTVTEIGALYVLDALTGEKLSYYDQFGYSQMHSAPSLYNGNLYVGCYDWNVYCFGEARLMDGQPAESGPGTIMPEEPQPTEPSVPAETPLITTEVAIIAVIAVAAVIGLVSFWALRKRK